jgi:Arc/MetJ family transcription regulator
MRVVISTIHELTTEQVASMVRHLVKWDIARDDVLVLPAGVSLQVLPEHEPKEDWQQ